MVYLLLGMILVLRAVQSITGKACSNRMPTEQCGIVSYMALRMGISAAAAVILLLLSGEFGKSFLQMPLTGWLLAVATGISLILSTLSSLLVMKRASVVLVSLFSMAGLLVPTISGIFLFGQPVAAGQWMGIALLFAATFFLSSASKETNGSIDWKTVFWLLVCMFSNGCTMLFQTLYKNNVPDGSISLYSFLQFALPAVILFVTALLWSIRKKQPIPGTDRELFGFTVFAAAAVFGISQISTAASAMIPVAVLFPVSDGGGMIISAITAALVFKEKLTIKSILGIIIGIAAIILIQIFV